MRSWLRDNANSKSNLVVVVPSTPAQYFHALRRQVVSSCRKPVALFTPKSLLHHRPCSSSLDDFGPDTEFQRVLPHEPHDSDVHAGKVRRVIMCSGQVYYTLRRARLSAKAFVRTCSLVLRHSAGLTRRVCLCRMLSSSVWRSSPRFRMSSWRKPLSTHTPTPNWCGCKRSHRTWGSGIMWKTAFGRWFVSSTQMPVRATLPATPRRPAKFSRLIRHCHGLCDTLDARWRRVQPGRSTFT